MQYFPFLWVAAIFGVDRKIIFLMLILWKVKIFSNIDKIVKKRYYITAIVKL